MEIFKHPDLESLFSKITASERLQICESNVEAQIHLLKEDQTWLIFVSCNIQILDDMHEITSLYKGRSLDTINVEQEEAKAIDLVVTSAELWGTV